MDTDSGGLGGHGAGRPGVAGGGAGGALAEYCYGLRRAVGLDEFARLLRVGLGPKQTAAGAELSVRAEVNSLRRFEMHLRDPDLAGFKKVGFAAL